MLPAYPLEDVFDPTGAGDTFGGSLIGYLASKDQVDFHTLRQAVAYGTVMASFTVEKFGLERLQALRMTDIEERLDAFRRMCAFS
jgi:sugar/nucleoside kinase (ribokinase family)